MVTRLHIAIDNIYVDSQSQKIKLGLALFDNPDDGMCAWTEKICVDAQTGMYNSEIVSPLVYQLGIGGLTNENIR